MYSENGQNIVWLGVDGSITVGPIAPVKKILYSRPGMSTQYEIKNPKYGTPIAVTMSKNPFKGVGGVPKPKAPVVEVISPTQSLPLDPRFNGSKSPPPKKPPKIDFKVPTKPPVTTKPILKPIKGGIIGTGITIGIEYVPGLSENVKDGISTGVVIGGLLGPKGAIIGGAIGGAIGIGADLLFPNDPAGNPSAPTITAPSDTTPQPNLTPGQTYNLYYTYFTGTRYQNNFVGVIKGPMTHTAWEYTTWKAATGHARYGWACTITHGGGGESGYLPSPQFVGIHLSASTVTPFFYFSPSAEYVTPQPTVTPPPQPKPTTPGNTPKKPTPTGTVNPIFPNPKPSPKPQPKPSPLPTPDPIPSGPPFKEPEPEIDLNPPDPNQPEPVPDLLPPDPNQPDPTIDPDPTTNPDPTNPNPVSPWPIPPIPGKPDPPSKNKPKPVPPGGIDPTKGTDPYPDSKPSPTPTNQQPSPCQPANSCNPCGGSAPSNPQPDPLLQQIYQNTEVIKGTTGTHYQQWGTYTTTDAAWKINTTATTTDTNTTLKTFQTDTVQWFTLLRDNLFKVRDMTINALSNQAVQGALTAVNTALNLHNAMMLSKNLAYTLGETINSVAQALNIKLKDEEGSEIEPTQLISGFISNAINAIIGKENAIAISETWRKASTIFSTGANLLNTFRDIGEQTRELTEMAIEHTGEIGNALRDAGVVFDDAYDRMATKVTAMTPFSRKIQAFKEGIENTEEVLESIDSVAQNVISIQESVNEIGENYNEFKQSIDDFKESEDTIFSQEKTNNQSPIIDDQDTAINDDP